MGGQFRSRHLPALSACKGVRARYWAALCLPMLVILAPTSARAAGGAFAVDDAVIANPGDCQVETWVALASNHDVVAFTQPACVVKLGIPVELTAVAGHARTDDVWVTPLGAKAKINILPVETGKIGVGLVEQPLWDGRNGQYLFNQLYVPFTFQFSDVFRINLNAGWQNDGIVNLNYALWGAGFEWNFVEQLTLIGEVFGLSGPVTPNAVSITEPRAQLGLRVMPVKNVDIDLIYGRNVNGENANWFTLGLNVRF
jgi:hypothetical protein